MPNRSWQRAVLAALLVAVTVMGVLSLAVHSTVVLVSLYAVAPALAAISLGGPATALVAAWAAAWSLAVSIEADTFSGPGRGTGFYTVLLVGAISTVAASKGRRRDMSYQQISHIAEVAQATIVRPIPATLGPLTFATVYRSAAREAQVGGDAYAAVAHPNGVRLLVADVRGKGLEAVAIAADVLASFREFAPLAPSLVTVAHRLEGSIQHSLGPEDFVTALLVDFTENRIDVVSCGHPWPLLRHAGTVREIVIDRPSLPLGLGVRPVVESHPFSVGDQLLAFTDGLVEARDRAGEFFEPAPVLRDLAADDPRAALDELITALDRHAGGLLADDLAVVLVERSAAARTGTLVEGVRLLDSPAG